VTGLLLGLTFTSILLVGLFGSTLFVGPFSAKQPAEMESEKRG